MLADGVDVEEVAKKKSTVWDFVSTTAKYSHYYVVVDVPLLISRPTLRNRWTHSSPLTTRGAAVRS